MGVEKKYVPFDAIKTPLQDSNLIEASAGTGKTYSIAILVLRLVLEQKLPIKQVLMVTFTRAAVAELEERIRLFVRSAYKASLGKTIKDDNIRQLVQRAIKTSDTATVQQQLKDAVVLLDELSVLTIHSFCQQTLNEFAFETNQLFGADMLPDNSGVLEEELNKFWRRHITTLHPALLERVWSEKMRANTQKLLLEHLGGKKYLGFDENTEYTIPPKEQAQRMKKLEAVLEKETALEQALHQYIAAHAVRLKTVCESNTWAKRGLPDLLSTPAAFIEELLSRRSSAYIGKLFPDILEKVDLLTPVTEQREQLEEEIRIQLNHLAIAEVSAGLRVYKERNNLLGYDDLVSNLHQALVENDNERLVTLLREKYKAVFIDEFQDTDRQQFEIFDRAFGKKTILFYIGDPKQSIYAWRKADIFTYFKARKSVQNLYGMNVNYRSAPALIDAMNQFFLPEEGFDTFAFGDQKETIVYIPVGSPRDGEERSLVNGKNPAPPISIYRFPNKEELVAAVAAQTAQLLREEGYRLGVKGKRRPVIPSDIGILVRTAEQGRDTKAALAKLGIPAVTIDDAKVLQSEEALYLLYLVEAVAAPDRSSINRALLSPFTGFRAADILALDDEAVLARFTRYKSRWQEDGIYTALMDFVADFGVRKTLLQSNSENGERIITNLFQLAELVHQVESRKNLSVPELISWLRRGIDGMATDGDEYMQRIESDDDAVKISTIHKSKGLEYKIVLAPFLDFVNHTRQEFLSFRDPVSGDYTSVERARLTEEQKAWQWEQAEQENRRLLYVAITRAVYKCYIFKNDASFNRNSTLATFLKALEETADPALIKFEKNPPELPAGRYRAARTPVKSAAPQKVHFQLLEENWRRMSYTMLAGKPVPTPRVRAFPEDDSYDAFVFGVLRRGARTGNFLHYIFEKIHFDDDAKWEFWLSEAIRHFVPGQQELYLPMLRHLLNQVLNARIGIDGTSFTLASVARDKRIPEFEFDFPVPLFIPDSIHSFSDSSATLLVKTPQELAAPQLEGIMNGKIDLFFEHNGRYYVLDWKSNYLGPSVDDYSPAMLAAAMNESNYHLQYLIYTIAAKKYLQSRIPGFDYSTQFGGVIYVFIRGARAGSEQGIFTVKPALDKIEALEEIIG